MNDLISQKSSPYLDCSFRFGFSPNKITFVVSDGINSSTIDFAPETDSVCSKFYSEVFIPMANELKFQR